MGKRRSEHRKTSVTPEPRKAAVERLVGDLDAVFVIAGAEQIGEELDVRADQRRDDRQKQPA